MIGMRISNLFGKITILVMVFLCINTAVALDGSGTQEDPWLIQSLDDFNDFAADANYWDWDDYTRLETDVNLVGRTYTTAVIAPDVNSSYFGFQGTDYEGVFDGNEHKIIGLTINGGGNDYMGLFGYLGIVGKISNLGIEGCNISGGDCVGGLLGWNSYASVSNCYSTGDVNGINHVGGLVGGQYEGSVSNCYSTSDVRGNDSVGGLMGENYEGSLSNCYSTGNVQGGWIYTGGLVGLVGISNGSVSNCYSTAYVWGDWYVGGLVGANFGNISDCFATDSVVGDDYVGGLVGYNYGDYGAYGVGRIYNCYSMGDVFGLTQVGGLVGHNIDGGYIGGCYSTGDVMVYDFWYNHVGCLVGYNDYDCEIWNCFWDIDTQTYGVNVSIGKNNGTANVAGLTTPQMQTKSTFTSAGWDFMGETANGTDDIWRLCEDLVHYPRLAWEFPSVDFVCPDGVDFFDYSFFAGYWAEDNCGSSNNCDGTDLDLLGTVDINDLRIFFDNWLVYPPPGLAGNPNPHDGEIFVSLTADLSWAAGLYATSHDVYFGTDNPPPFIRNQLDTTYEPGALDAATWYYWRIDEVNPSGTTKGTAWSFETVPFFQ